MKAGMPAFLACDGDPKWRVVSMLCVHLWMQDIEPLLDSQSNPVTDSRGNPIPKVSQAAAGLHAPPCVTFLRGTAAARLQYSVCAWLSSSV